MKPTLSKDANSSMCPRFEIPHVDFNGSQVYVAQSFGIVLLATQKGYSASTKPRAHPTSPPKGPVSQVTAGGIVEILRKAFQRRSLDDDAVLTASDTISMGAARGPEHSNLSQGPIYQGPCPEIQLSTERKVVRQKWEMSGF